MVTQEHITKYLEANGYIGTFNAACLLKDKGEGNFIARWEPTDIDEPTLSILSTYQNAVDLDASKAAAIEQLKVLDNVFDARVLEDVVLGNPVRQEVLDAITEKTALRAILQN